MQTTENALERFRKGKAS